MSQNPENDEMKTETVTVAGTKIDTSNGSITYELAGPEPEEPNTPKAKYSEYDYHDIRVITYNVLSEHYATKEFFPNVWDGHLEFEPRSVKMAKLFNSWMNANFIICLQEVSDGWDAKFMAFFKKTKYRYVSTTYADGKMGVGIAFPKFHYDLLDQKVTVCGEFITEIYDNLHKNLLKNKQQIDSRILGELCETGVAPNQMLTLLLAANKGGKTIGKNIVVSTYHMPCKYLYKYYMMAHVYALKHHLKYLSKEWGTSHGDVQSVVLAGDFNIVPTSPEYKFLADVKLAVEDTEAVALTKSFHSLLDTAGYDPLDYMEMRSAHLTFHGTEPQYTNVCIQPNKRFVKCLDYILISDLIEIRSVMVGLTVDDPYKTAYPNGLSPSDHVPESASLRVI